jgi:hypothetical protein
LQLKHPISVNLRKIYGQYFLDLTELLCHYFGNSRQNKDDAKRAALALSAFSTGLTTHYRLFHHLLDLPMKKILVEESIVAAILS